MKYIIVAVLFISVTMPLTVDASHRTYGGYGGGVDRSDLDNDIVEKIAIPILFGVTYDQIYPDFGDPRGDGTRSHEGEDLLAPQSTPIVSPTEAIVMSVGTGSSAGKYVYTANPGGETFRYMHLDEIADIKRGDKLSLGDLIGTVGDTGNAAGGVYHLHFEMRDSKNVAQDPYLRLAEAFTLKEKMSFLKDVLNNVSDEDEYAAFLVEEFTADFKEALQKGYSLPNEIEDALADAGIFSTKTLQDQLDGIIESIPAILSMQLQNGVQGTSVSLLQLYLIYTHSGVERDALLAAGATGYYGPITASAVRAMQQANSLPVTGVYDIATREGLLRL